ncbi:MAG: hypothetical protein HFF44_09815 [Lawsonibacter sp.]|nr:hypothetical protein [Lawsonibacter sp.]
MAETTAEKPQAEEVQQQSLQPEEKQPEKEPPKKAKLPKEGGLLLTVLTILFVLVGIGELALWSFTGFRFFQGSQARRAYQAQQAAQTGTAPSASSYSGPWLIVENGTVVWRWEEDLTGSNGSSSVTVGGIGSTQNTVTPVLKTPYPPPPWERTDPEEYARQAANASEPVSPQTPTQT